VCAWCVDSAPDPVEWRGLTGGIRDSELVIELVQQHSHKWRECKCRDGLETDGGGGMGAENGEVGEIGSEFERERERDE
jgi:hypothetical protein